MSSRDPRTGSTPGRSGSRPSLAHVLGEPSPQEAGTQPPGTTRVPLWVGVVLLVAMVQFTLGPAFATAATVISLVATFGTGYGWFAETSTRRPPRV